MPLLRSHQAYDRQRLLEAAGQARARNKRHKAIALYRWILAVERNNIELHTRLAPLLAETGQEFDAWISYRTVAQAALREGREDKALAVYREASKLLPREIEVWLSLARVLGKRGEESEAVEMLLEGSRSFRSPYLRPQAIHLLRRARTLSPWHFETVIELAQLLCRTDQREEARVLLEGLAERCEGHRLRRVRRVELRLDPGPAALWRLLRSGPREDTPEPEATEPQEVVSIHSRRAKR
jgi:tetratricopeptide (TPR) repeat protein